ncbi:hypothetical protein ACFLXN_02560 [Chloroflexota bacterium]
MPTYVLLLAIYIVTIYQYTSTGKHVMKAVTRGKVAPVFYLGAVGLDIILPLSVVIAGAAGAVSNAVLAAAIAGGIIGDLSLRYCIFRCGFYAPLLTASKY